MLSFSFLQFLAAARELAHRNVQNHLAFCKIQALESIYFLQAVAPSSAAKSVSCLIPSYWRASSCHLAQLNAKSCNPKALESAFLDKIYSTSIEAIASVERLLLLCFELRIIEISTAAHHIDGLVLPWAWKFLQSHKILIIWDEILVSIQLQFLG